MLSNQSTTSVSIQNESVDRNLDILYGFVVCHELLKLLFLMKLSTTVPVTAVSDERSFSTLKYTNTFLRNRQA